MYKWSTAGVLNLGSTEQQMDRLKKKKKSSIWLYLLHYLFFFLFLFFFNEVSTTVFRSEKKSMTKIRNHCSIVNQYTNAFWNTQIKGKLNSVEGATVFQAFHVSKDKLRMEVLGQMAYNMVLQCYCKMVSHLVTKIFCGCLASQWTRDFLSQIDLWLTVVYNSHTTVLE